MSAIARLVRLRESSSFQSASIVNRILFASPTTFILHALNICNWNIGSQLKRNPASLINECSLPILIGFQSIPLGNCEKRSSCFLDVVSCTIQHAPPLVLSLVTWVNVDYPSPLTVHKYTASERHLPPSNHSHFLWQNHQRARQCLAMS